MLSEKEYREKVKKLLIKAGINETELNIAVEKIYKLANIFFDKWLEHQKRAYEKRKV